MKKIEENNTLVFLVDIKANKRQIKNSLKQLYDVDCVKVNTLIRYAFNPGVAAAVVQKLWETGMRLDIMNANADLEIQTRRREEGILSLNTRSRRFGHCGHEAFDSLRKVL